MRTGPIILRPSSLFLALTSGVFVGCGGTQSPLFVSSLVTDTQIVCEDPLERASLGPMVRHSPSGDWQLQWAQSRWPEKGDTRQGMGVSVVDLTGDGILDILLPNFGADQYFVGQSDGTYRDETAKRWPAPDTDPTEALSVADVDGDGDLDVVAANRGAPNALYLNDGTGSFSVSDTSGFVSAVHGSVGAVFGDLDLDGDLDMMMNNHLVTEYPGSVEWGDPNVLYDNRGDGTFLDQTDRLPAVLNDGFAYMASLVDVTGDLYPDIYVTNDFGPMARPNQLFVNPGILGVQFLEMASARSAALAIGGMGMGFGDINGDGLPDFVMTNWGPIMILESDGHGGYVSTENVRGVEWTHDDGPYASWAVDLQDLDNDGDLDFLAASGQLMEPNNVAANPMDQPDGLFLRDGDVFVESGESWGMHEDVGNTRGVVIADLNGDGFFDMVKRDIRADAHIWLARCDTNSWTTVVLRDDAANGFAVGARVTVSAEGVDHHRWVGSTGKGFASSGPHSVHFGLGAATIIDAIEVRWPTGGVTRYEGVAVNSPVTISRLRSE